MCSLVTAGPSALRKGCLVQMLGPGVCGKGWPPSGVCGLTRGSFPSLLCHFCVARLPGPPSAGFGGAVVPVLVRDKYFLG